MKTFPVEFFDMARPRFVHLRMHSEYWFTDGMGRIDDAVERAAADHMPALALTDAANLFGMVKFYGAARAAGVKPIVGADCWIENPAERDKPFRLLLLCSSRPGYLRLCELLSRAWLANQFRGRALIARRWLEEGCEGLIALSGFLAGELAPPLLSDHAESAERIARGYSELFPGRYYIELQRAGQPNGEALLSRSVALAGRLRLPVVATHPVQFLDAEDFKAHEARVCIAQGYLLGDQRRPKAFTPEQYFKSPEEMARLFGDAPQAPDRWSRIRSASPTSTRCATTCFSSASSTPSASQCRTSTSTSARTGAIASSITYAASSASKASRRLPPSAPWRRAPWCATSAACSTSATTSATRSRS